MMKTFLFLLSVTVFAAAFSVSAAAMPRLQTAIVGEEALVSAYFGSGFDYNWMTVSGGENARLANRFGSINYVTGLKPGKAVFMVSYKYYTYCVGEKGRIYALVEAETDFVYVTVKEAATGIALSTAAAAPTAGSTVSLGCTLSPAGSGGTVTWSSSDTSVATVSGGFVKTLKPGTATITAKLKSGASAVCTVTASAPVPKALQTGPAASNGADGVDLTWGVSSNATGYKIYRDNALLAAATGSRTTAYTDTTAVTGTVYTYDVIPYIHVDRDYDGSPSAGASVLYLAQPVLKSVASGPVVSWNAVAGAESYSIYRHTASSAAWSLLTSGQTGTSYTDTSAASGTDTYYYTVQAVSGAAASAYNKSGVSIDVIASPAVNSATCNYTGTYPGITVAWDAIAGANFYSISYYPSAEALADSGSIAGSEWKVCYSKTTSVTLGSSNFVNPEYLYSYICVQACTGTYYSSSFAIVTNSSAANTNIYEAAFCQPVDSATLAATNCGTWVSVGCEAVEMGGYTEFRDGNYYHTDGVPADNYDVYRRTGSTGWALIGSTASLPYHDGTVTGGETYSYTIAACFAGDTAPYDNTGVSVTVSPLEAAEAASAFGGGTGTADDPYQIADAAQLLYFDELLGSEATMAQYAGKCYVLTADIAFNSTANYENWRFAPPRNIWRAACSGSCPFTGRFDGGGHTVTGLYAGDGVMFAEIGGSGSVLDLDLSGCAFFGGIAGTNEGTISGCSSDAVICGTDDGGNTYNGGSILQNADYVTLGGIANENYGTISDCTFSGAIKGIYCGGIAAVNGAGGVIEDCLSSGTFALNYNGGIAGENSGEIADCTFTGTITASFSGGGIVYSNLASGSVSRCVNEGTVPWAGIAENSAGTVTACKNAGTVSIAGIVYGVAEGGTVTACKNESACSYAVACYNYGAITDCLNTGAADSGLVGYNNGTLAYGSNTGASTYGLVYKNYGALTNCFFTAASKSVYSSTGTVTGCLHLDSLTVSDTLTDAAALSALQGADASLGFGAYVNTSDLADNASHVWAVTDSAYPALYWETTYTLTLLNGSTDESGESSSLVGGTVCELPERNGLERTGYIFDGWLVNGAHYAAGGTFTLSENTVVAADWAYGYSLTVTAGGAAVGTVTADKSAGQNELLAAAAYDENGKMLALVTQTVSPDEADYITLALPCDVSEKDSVYIYRLDPDLSKPLSAKLTVTG